MKLIFVTLILIVLFQLAFLVKPKYRKKSKKTQATQPEGNIMTTFDDAIKQTRQKWQKAKQQNPDVLQFNKKEAEFKNGKPIINLGKSKLEQNISKFANKIAKDSFWSKGVEAALKKLKKTNQKAYKKLKKLLKKVGEVDKLEKNIGTLKKAKIQVKQIQNMLKKYGLKTI